MIDYNRIGARIQMVRRLSDVTREELAEKTGLSFSIVSAIERGACQDHDAIDAVCRALDVDTAYTLDPSNAEAAQRAWGKLDDEDIERAKRILAMKNGPGA